MTFSNLLRSFSFLIAAVFLINCAGGDQASAPSSSGKSLDSPAVSIDHKTPLDTVDWRTVLDEGATIHIPDSAREWPGEEIGLIGPIIATGGRGADTYVLIYDPAGVLVGGMTRREAKTNPERLNALIRLAHKRGEIQNLHAIQFMAARVLHDLTAEPAERGTK